MAVLRTLVVDDEELARERLKVLLEAFGDIEVIGEASDGEEAIERIVELRPDLVFLDIQMPGCSGIEVAASLPAGSPVIVFCTAYDQYAIEAFEVSAVEYLLKPVSRVRLSKAVERVRGTRESDRGIEQAVRSVTPARFLGKRGNRYRVIPRKSVLYFCSEGGLTQLWTHERYYWMEPALTELENRLAGVGFYRISRQALVNLGGVAEIIPLIGGHGQVKLTNGKVLDVSRRRMKALLEELEKE